MTDVIIVGGGPAGAALAILLGRQGIAVELHERGRFPREKPCGEGVMPAGVAVLRRLGLEEAVGGFAFHGVRYRVTNTTPIGGGYQGMRHGVDDGTRTGGAMQIGTSDGRVSGECVALGRFPASNGQPAMGLAQRRSHFDRVLFEAAAATSGVCAFTGSAVEGLVGGNGNGRVEGVIAAGRERRAKLVVAADGAQSRTRSLLGWNPPVNGTRRRVGMRAHFRLAAGQTQEPWVDVFVGPGHELYVTPLPRDELLVAALADAEVVRESRSAGATGNARKFAESNRTPVRESAGLKAGATFAPGEGAGGATMARAFAGWCMSHRALVERLEGAEQVSELLATSPLSGRARNGAGPGIVLLGDAAGSCDPVTGGGIAQALVSAELLAHHIVRHGVTEQSWLDDFDRARCALLRDYARLTGGLLWLTAHPWLAKQAVRVAARVPRVVSHLVGVAGGVRPLVGIRNRALP
ncbi:MAG: NAD(P)/FAD-dependent oxidoreductase [Candidatus Acidiferrales bacterium]